MVTFGIQVNYLGAVSFAPRPVKDASASLVESYEASEITIVI
jgi:hypothetical protein